MNQSRNIVIYHKHENKLSWIWLTNFIHSCSNACDWNIKSLQLNSWLATIAVIEPRGVMRSCKSNFLNCSTVLTVVLLLSNKSNLCFGSWLSRNTIWRVSNTSRTENISHHHNTDSRNEYKMSLMWKWQKNVWQIWIFFSWLNLFYADWFSTS